MNMSSTSPLLMKSQSPQGINHLVLNVLDIDESHHFWTAMLGFEHVGTSQSGGANGEPPARFYSGRRNGKLRHHDFALYQSAVQPSPQARLLNHLAIEYATEGEWLEQIRFLMQHDVRLFNRIERGTMHSVHLTDPNGIPLELVFELAREHWEDDIQGALNRARKVELVG